MDANAKNAAAVCTCTLCLLLADLTEQVSSKPIDITSPSVGFSAGTAAMRTFDAYVEAPPRGRIEPLDEMRVFIRRDIR